MNLLRLLVASIVALSPLAAAAAGVKGNVIYLGIVLNQEGNAGGWERVGDSSEWDGTIAGTILGGKLFTVEKSGALYRTDLASGQWVAIGKSEFSETKFMVSVGADLYTIENSGTLYRVNPADGSWQSVGKGGKWKKTIAATALNQRIYTIESGGQLHGVNPQTGNWRQIGKPEFGETRLLFAARSSLYTIENDGSLYEVSPTDGTWAQIGAGGAWKNVIAGTVINDRLYTVEKDDRLYSTDPRTGERHPVGNQYGASRFMFASGEHAYTLEESGLYRIKVRAGLKLSEWDWCVDEYERVWKEQGAGLSRGLQGRKITGEAATKPAIVEGLKWLQQSAGPDDLVVLYVGGHGATDPQTGWGMATADNDVITGAEIKNALARVRSPVLVFVDTCGSGGFVFPHPKGDPPVPPHVTAFCGCAPHETTGNALDVAILEGLYGRADFNRDDLVDLDELTQYYERRYKERWPEGGEGSNTPTFARGAKVPGSLTLTHVAKTLSAAVIRNQFYSVLNLGMEGDRFKIHTLGYSNRPADGYFVADKATRDQICLETEGPPLLVEQDDEWLPARQIATNGKNITVRLLGKNSREVTVKPNQIRYPFVGRPR